MAVEKDLEERFAKLEKDMNLRLEDLLGRFSELEKHTVWRIKDCEELLKTRVNE